FHVVALRRCHLFLSLCGEKSFVLALLPLDPANAFLDVGEPAVDRGPELRFPAQPCGERDVADPEAETAAQLGERAELVQLTQSVEPVTGRRARRDDEPGLLEVAEHAGGPACVLCGVPDAERIHLANLNTAVSMLVGPHPCGRSRHMEEAALGNLRLGRA